MDISSIFFRNGKIITLDYGLVSFQFHNVLIFPFVVLGHFWTLSSSFELSTGQAKQRVPESISQSAGER